MYYFSNCKLIKKKLRFFNKEINNNKVTKGSSGLVRFPYGVDGSPRDVIGQISNIRLVLRYACASKSTPTYNAGNMSVGHLDATYTFKYAEPAN